MRRKALSEAANIGDKEESMKIKWKLYLSLCKAFTRKRQVVQPEKLSLFRNRGDVTNCNKL